MEQWTDKAIKQHIEDLIEESYILSLSDHGTREYFRDFIDACDHILQTNVSIHENLKTVRIKMALLKARFLVDRHSVIVVRRNKNGDLSENGHDLFARQIVSTKRAILRLFESLDPRLAQAVIDESVKRKMLKQKEAHRMATLENRVLAAGYYLLLALVTALILFLGIH